MYKAAKENKNYLLIHYSYIYLYVLHIHSPICMTKNDAMNIFLQVFPGCPALLQHNVLLNQLTSETNTLWCKRRDISTKGKAGTFPRSYVNYSAESFMHTSCTPEHALVSKIPSSFLIPVK